MSYLIFTKILNEIKINYQKEISQKKHYNNEMKVEEKPQPQPQQPQQVERPQQQQVEKIQVPMQLPETPKKVEIKRSSGQF